MTGIRVIQLTQLITILGGGAGYILCVNTFAAALVEPEERTATFGRLQGIQMLGSAAALSRTSTFSPSACLSLTESSMFTSWRFPWRSIRSFGTFHPSILSPRTLDYHFGDLPSLHPSANCRRDCEVVNGRRILRSPQDLPASSRREWGETDSMVRALLHRRGKLRQHVCYEHDPDPAATRFNRRFWIHSLGSTFLSSSTSGKLQPN